MENKGRTASTSFMLTLFTIFAVLALLLVLYGARVYTRVVARMDDGYALRASLNYVANKLHGNGGAGPVTIETLGGIESLVIDNGEEGLVCVYFDDGALSEQYVLEREAFMAGMGTRLIELADVDFSIDSDGAVTLKATTEEGTQRETTIRARAGGEG